MVGQSGFKRAMTFTGLYGAVFAYVAFALLPIYWTVKISVTPQSLLYSEGIKLWPSRVTLENYATVLAASDFPRYFVNSLIVSIGTALIVTVVASLAGYALSRFDFRGKAWVGLALLLTTLTALLASTLWRIGPLVLSDLSINKNIEEFSYIVSSNAPGRRLHGVFGLFLGCDVGTSRRE